MKEGVEISRKIPGHHKTFKRHQPAMSFVPHHNERRFYGQEDSRDCATPTRVWSHLTDLCFGNIWAVNHVYTCVCNGEKYSCTVLKQMSQRWHAFPTAHLIIKQNHLSASFNRSGLCAGMRSSRPNFVVKNKSFSAQAQKSRSAWPVSNGNVSRMMLFADLRWRF